MIRRSIVSVACLASLAPALPALGQGASELDSLELNPYKGTRLSAGVGYQTETDIDDGGEFSVLSLNLRGGPAFNCGENLTIGTLFSYHFRAYDFSGLGDDPWENIHTFRATPLAYYNIDDRWSVYGGPTFAFSGEEGADFSHSFTGGGIAGFNYQAHPKLSLGAGIGFFSQIEDDAKFVPIITANWQFHDHWNLRVGVSEVAASSGLGAEVSYALTHQWTLGAGIQFQRKRFLLDEDGPIPDGVGEEKSVPIYARVGWEASKNFGLEFMFGVAAGGEIQIDDSTGHKIDDSDYDAAALLGLRAIFKF